ARNRVIDFGAREVRKAGRAIERERARDPRPRPDKARYRAPRREGSGARPAPLLGSAGSWAFVRGACRTRVVAAATSRRRTKRDPDVLMRPHQGTAPPAVVTYASQIFVCRNPRGSTARMEAILARSGIGTRIADAMRRVDSRVSWSDLESLAGVSAG